MNIRMAEIAVRQLLVVLYMSGLKKQQPIGDAGNHRVGPDTNRQGYQGNRRKTWILA